MFSVCCIKHTTQSFVIILSKVNHVFEALTCLSWNMEKQPKNTAGKHRSPRCLLSRDVESASVHNEAGHSYLNLIETICCTMRYGTSNIHRVTSGRNSVMMLPPSTDERFKSSYCAERKQTLRHWSDSSTFTIETIHKSTAIEWSIACELCNHMLSVCDWYFCLDGLINNALWSLAITQFNWDIRWGIHSLIVLNKWSKRCIFTNNRSNSRSNQTEETVQLLIRRWRVCSNTLKAQRCVFKQTNTAKSLLRILSFLKQQHLLRVEGSVKVNKPWASRITFLHQMTHMWSTKAVISNTGIFVAIDTIHCMGQNYTFFCYDKNH